MSDTPRILIVDDDAELRELLTQTLTQFGFSPVAVSCGIDMFRELESRPCDLALLDIMLQGEDGLSLCRELRASGSAWADIPVIFLTARRSLADKIVGLELGGDDYLAKPFQARELVARIRAHLRRAKIGQTHPAPCEEKGSASLLPEGTKGNIWKFGPWRIDVPARHLITPDNVAVSLSSAEYRLLLLFLEHPRTVLSRETLAEHMLERRPESGDRTLDVQISRLRAKLGDRDRRPPLIRTMRGDGYMLAVTVEKE